MSEKKNGMKKGLFVAFLFAVATASCVSTVEREPYSNCYSQAVVDEFGDSLIVWSGWQGSYSNDYEIYWVKVDASGTPGEVRILSHYGGMYLVF